MKIDIPELSIVALVGPDSNIKQNFMKKHFALDEILTLDDLFYEEEESEEEADVAADLLDSLYKKAENRLREGKFTVIDAPHIEAKDRKKIIESAKRQHCFPVAIVFSGQEDSHSDQNSGDETDETIKRFEKEGFRYVYLIESEEEVDKREVFRSKLYNNKRDIHGPFDIIGDVHGCYDELCDLFEKLGYEVDRERCLAEHPNGRIAAFVGDLVDRGPKSMAVLRLVMGMVKKGTAYSVLGNHDGKLQRKLKGSNVQVAHGLETTLKEMEEEDEMFIQEVKAFLDGRISHYVFDEGKLVVAHAGLKEKLHGRGSRRIRELAMFGETTGKKDKFGLPERLNWAKGYHGRAFVVYGHTPHEKVNIINNTANIDTGCVFGGKLTAFRYPEKEIVDVKARAVYYEPSRPLFIIGV